MRSLALRLVAFAFVITTFGCSGSGGSGGKPDGSASQDGGGSSCNPACGSGSTCQSGRCVSNDGGVTTDDGGIVTTDAGDDHCVATSSKGEKKPLDMYIMLDKSGSMDDEVSGGSTKWVSVTNALNDFLAQPGMNGMSVGLQYFALPDANHACVAYKTVSCTRNSDCGDCGPCAQVNHQNRCILGYSGDTCDAAVYATADIEISPVSSAAPQIAESIAQHSPGSYTPTSAALQGAIDHARAWASSHPQDVAIAVLATDGQPTECDVSLTNIGAIAVAGVSGSPKILTFVIGVGDSLANLDGIARSGGTTSAFLVDTSGDVNAQFLDALNQIRGAAVGCNYLIPNPPSGQLLDYNKVNVQFTPGAGGAAEGFVQAQSKSACATNTAAWYYDDPGNPTQIVLCPDTCTRVEADSGGQIDVLLGCRTNIGPN